MDIEEQDSNLEQELKNQRYKDPSYVKKKQKQNQIITYLNSLKPAQDADKIKQQLSMIENIISFFGPAILICFQNYYNELKERNDVIDECTNQIKNIASLVKSTIQNKSLEEVKFFQFLGINKKKYQKSKSIQEKEFLNYICKLSELLKDLQKKIQKGRKFIQKDNLNNINQQIGNLLEQDLQRQLTFFEINFQNYFKSKTMKILQQIQSIFQQSNSEPSTQIKQIKIKNNIESKVQVNYKQIKNQQIVKPNSPLCCRSFFYKFEDILQPQSLRIEYKNYNFPYNYQLIEILKKTFCGFLNAEGGVIFIGIAENKQTKKRVVYGEYYDENVKEKVLKQFRRIAEAIEPDIVTTQKLYNVEFIPIKKKSPPYHYISGCYVIKISIRYGIRDDIYSYYNADGLQLYAFRTENEVIHRRGREVLNALRERIKNPLPIPQKIHEGNCPPPQVGKPIHYGEKYPDQIENERKVIYKQKEKQNKFDLKNQLKTDECLYIANRLSESNVKQLLQKQLDINTNQIKTQNYQNWTLLEIINYEALKKFKQGIQQFKKQNFKVQFTQVTFTLRIADKQQLQIVKDIFTSQKIKFKNPRGQNEFVFQKKSQGLELYKMLRNMEIKAEFI